MLIFPRGKKGKLHLRIRVPTRFRGVHPGSHFNRALGTDSMDVAERKAKAVRDLFFAKLEALKAGQDGDAAILQEQLVAVCERMGFQYLPAAGVASAPLRDVLARTRALDAGEQVEADALLGGGGDSGLMISGLFDRYERLKRVDNLQKSPRQLKSWAATPQRAARNFGQAVGDISVEELTRADAIKFRSWLAKRIECGEITPYSANREIYTLSKMIKDVTGALTGNQIDVFGRLLFAEPKTRRRNRQVSFSPEWIRSRLLAPEALTGANDEARDILLAMINTGARPSELAALRADTINLADNIPHILIRPNERETKSASAEREIPLSGVSLEAVRRHPDGFPRYRDKANSWSGAIGRYMKANGLRETDEHGPYSLRHSFSDALLNVGCPEPIKDQLMGHREKGTAYGLGADLSVKAAWIDRIAY